MKTAQKPGAESILHYSPNHAHCTTPPRRVGPRALVLGAMCSAIAVIMWGTLGMPIVELVLPDRQPAPTVLEAVRAPQLSAMRSVEPAVPKRHIDVGATPPSAQGGGGASAQSHARTTESQDAKLALVQLTNRERAERELHDVQLDDNLTAMAQEWADEIARRHDLIHRSEAGKSGLADSRASGLVSFGENLYSCGRGARAGVPIAGWMRSDGHRRNLLQPAFSRLGIGISQSHDGRIWIVAEYGGVRGSAPTSKTIPSASPAVVTREDGPLLLN